MVKSKWIGWRVSILMTLCVAIGVALFLASLFVTINVEQLGEANYDVLYIAITNRSTILNTIMGIVTSLANPISFVVIISGIVFVWGIQNREFWRPLLLTAVMSFTAALFTIIKLVVRSPRPDVIDMVPPLEMDFSFPSGHTICTIVFLLVFGYLVYSRYVGRDRAFWLFAWMSSVASGTLIIAFTRLYLGYHWLTDITGAIGLGLVIFGITVFIDKYVTHHRRKTKRTKITL